MDNGAAGVNRVDRCLRSVDGLGRAGRDLVPPLGLRPTGHQIRTYRAQGIWRDVTAVADLRRWRRDIPGSVAITAGRADGGTRHITYEEYAQYVERLTGALHELGVGPGQVVAIQLPNWWQTSALVLACARLGAVIAPVTTTIRPHELESMLAVLRASVCVTVDRWADFEHSAALADIATRLPHLRHRVVLGEHVRTGEVDFALHFEYMPWEKRHGSSLDDPGEDPDQVSVVTFTSGSTGSPKAVLHTFNTFYAGYSPIAAEDELGPDDRLFTPHPLTHGWGLRTGILLPLLVGARSVVLDTWEPEAALDLLVRTGATVVLAAPGFLSGLVAEARKQSERLPAVRRIVTGATIPDGLITELADWFGVTPQSTRGMSEVIGGTRTRLTDPVDLPPRSHRAPRADLEIVRSDGQMRVDPPAALRARLQLVPGHREPRHP
jgi:cyclohexanecarboxylate-CoA ligase